MPNRSSAVQSFPPERRVLDMASRGLGESRGPNRICRGVTCFLFVDNGSQTQFLEVGIQFDCRNP